MNTNYMQLQTSDCYGKRYKDNPDLYDGMKDVQVLEAVISAATGRKLLIPGSKFDSTAFEKVA
jgi:hypothetical protein